jgi:hypothetical protein
MIILALVIGLAGTTYYFYQKSKHSTLDQQTQSSAETDALIKAVGKIVLLPENETPTIATVSDPSKLKDQAFFTNAQQGDKVLIYTNAKEAILYRPSIDKVVTISPINIDTGVPGTTAPTTAPTTSTKN